jgi:predicted SnoaL-like aldol condensation-catalyzing enzyme
LARTVLIYRYALDRTVFPDDNLNCTKESFMNLRGFTVALLGAVSALGQQPAVQANPAPGCTSTPAQLEANKKVAMEFFRTRGAGRVALADPSYKQHNPQFKRRAEENKVSDYEEFKTAFLSQPQGPGAGPGPGVGPMPPRGNPFEIVTAECDIVTIIHKMNRPDPTAEGKFYEFFTFDSFRVKNGKLTEHWDGSMIPPVRRTQ